MAARISKLFNVYLYTFPLKAGKTVKSLTLPGNRYVVVLAATLASVSPVAQPQSCATPTGK